MIIIKKMVFLITLFLRIRMILVFRDSLLSGEMRITTVKNIKVFRWRKVDMKDLSLISKVPPVKNIVISGLAIKNILKVGVAALR